MEHCISIRFIKITAVMLALTGCLYGQEQSRDALSQSEVQDILTTLGIKVTSGAAPGYVEDRACSLCHAEQYHSYQEVGMARAFSKPRPENDIEDFTNNTYYHERSKRYYEMTRSGTDLIFKRYQLAADGKPINTFETKVSWIMGSGYHSRVYLYQTEMGELFQLPLAWYSQTRQWRMAPGYDREDHNGVNRRVRRECMFCHNAYPDVPEGSDLYGEPHTFPKDLPEGTGCQRCHGPGEKHVRIAFKGEKDPAGIKASIVNPGKLSPQQRDDICFECHMQPSIVITGIRRFGKGDYSFRPGQSLPEYRLNTDVVIASKTKDERFEINHHPYRLIQSKCYLESKDDMSCLTCHDPHVKVKPEQSAEHFRKACQTCHQEKDACARKSNPVHTAADKSTALDNSDCASCHMPKRRTQDVVHVYMTDHFIRRQPGGPELLAPLEETVPVVEDIILMDGERAPDGPLGEAYRALAVLRAGGGANALNYYKLKLLESRPPEMEAYLSLARDEIKARRFDQAEYTLDQVLKLEPENKIAHEWKGLALSGQGKYEAAVATLQKLLTESPDRPEAQFNLGRILLSQDKVEEAIPHLEKAIELRPGMEPAWYFLGRAHAHRKYYTRGIECYRRALEINPTYTPAYISMGELLEKNNQRDEAIRFWEQGLAMTGDQSIAEALKKLREAPERGQ